jgi:DNA-directed RNA polymerase subunit RPC12/RpoP
MVLDAAVCRHRWERLVADDLWQCRLCGRQRVACPHPSWRPSVSGAGYVCGWCGVEPEDARDEPAEADDPVRR